MTVALYSPDGATFYGLDGTHGAIALCFYHAILHKAFQILVMPGAKPLKKGTVSIDGTVDNMHMGILHFRCTVSVAK